MYCIQNCIKSLHYFSVVVLKFNQTYSHQFFFLFISLRHFIEVILWVFDPAENLWILFKSCLEVSYIEILVTITVCFCLFTTDTDNSFKVRCNFIFKIFYTGLLLGQFFVHRQELNTECVIVFLEYFAFPLNVTHHKRNVDLFLWIAIIEHIHKYEIVFQHDVNSLILWMVCRSTRFRRCWILFWCQVSLPYRCHRLRSLCSWPF